MMKKVLGVAVVATLLASGSAFAKEDGKNIQFDDQNFQSNQVVFNFDDDNSSWAKQYIEYAGKKGYMHGDKGTKHFRPNDTLSREEFATVFNNKFHLSPATTTINFTDEPQNRYSYNNIEALTTAHYMDYYQLPNQSVFSFRPSAPVTRQDVAETLVKAYNLPLLDLASSQQLLQQFKDANNIAPNLVRYVATAVQNKIMQGDGKTFRPLSGLSRAETATLLYRLDNSVLVTGTATDGQTTTSGNTTVTVTGTTTDTTGTSSTTGSTGGTTTSGTPATGNTTSGSGTSTSTTSSNSGAGTTTPTTGATSGSTGTTPTSGTTTGVTGN